MQRQVLEKGFLYVCLFKEGRNYSTGTCDISKTDRKSLATLWVWLQSLEGCPLLTCADSAQYDFYMDRKCSTTFQMCCDTAVNKSQM